MWSAYVPALGVPSGTRVMHQNHSLVLNQARIENCELSKKHVPAKQPTLGQDLVPENSLNFEPRKSAFASGKRNEGILKEGLVADGLPLRRKVSRITESTLQISDSPLPAGQCVVRPQKVNPLRPPDLLGRGLQDQRIWDEKISRANYQQPTPQLGRDLVPTCAKNSVVFEMHAEEETACRPFVRRYGNN